MRRASRSLRPKLAHRLEATSRVELLQRNLGSVGGDATRLADAFRLVPEVALLIALLLGAGALALAADRRQAVVELGVAAAVTGVLLVVAYGVARSRAIAHVEGPEGRAAAGAVWNAFLGDLRTAAWILAGSGAVVAAAAASLIRPVDIREPVRRVAAWVATEPRRPWLRVLRGICLLAAGLLVVLDGQAVLQLALTLLGVFLIYEGVTVLLQVIYRPPVRSRGEGRERAPPRRRPAAAGWRCPFSPPHSSPPPLRSSSAPAAPPPPRRRGERARGTSPSATVPWIESRSRPPTTRCRSRCPAGSPPSRSVRSPDQLADGVRGLLIDTYYADRLSSGRLRTDLGSRESLRRRPERDGVSPDAVDAASRIRNRLGFAGEGERGMYLCHSFCELGGSPLSPVLDEIHDFLISHPNEVLVIINQDSVTPKDFVGAVKRAGLAELAYTPPAHGAWASLGQMIDRNKRVVFLAEKRAGAAPWYQLAYKRITEETPYNFPRVALLTEPKKLAASCRPGRGPARAPLFLLNHWVATAPVLRPSDAAKVNAYGPLLRRARTCARLRRHIPNLLAVNFYREGDLFRVVDELNGVR